MSLFDAIHAAVHQRNFGCEAVAARMRSMGFAGMTAGVLQKKVDTNCDTHNLRVDEMLAIMQIVNTDRFAIEIARLRFMLCIHGATFEGVADSELLDLFLKSESERGEWAAACKDALQDGSISQKEFERIEREYVEAASADVEVVERLRSMIDPRTMRRV